MQGHWQKETPQKNGHYWTAMRDGTIAGIKTVVYDGAGKLVYAGMHVDQTGGWQGWWWSEPIEQPNPPTESW